MKHIKTNQTLNHTLLQAQQILNAGNKSQVITLLTEYCAKNINNADIRREIGEFLQKNNMPVKAEKFYIESLHINNNQAIVHFNLGIIYQHTNRIKEAIESYLQATKILPTYARAYANLGYLYKQTGDIKRCRQACLAAQQLEPDDPQVKHMIASLGIENAPEVANQDYIKNLYNDYADNYDQHLSVTLKSKVPELIYQTTLKYLDNHKENLNLLDLGCGTGICGALFSKHVQKMTGVDLSKMMIAKAEKKNIYTSLFTSDINEYLSNNSVKNDIVISSDVLIYIGNLRSLFAGVNKTLSRGGLFSFSTESLENSSDNYSLNDSGRYKHNILYIKKLAEENEFAILSSSETALRQQSKQDVIGRIYILKKHGKTS